jgi:GNAT superfamily N-acetyltransferase
MQQINITLCGQLDAETLALLGRTTFHDTFAAQYTPEDMEQYLNATFTTGQISSELKDPNVQYYLATAAEEPVGYLKLNLSAAQTEFKDKQALEIERIYVAKAYLGEGVGQLLINKVVFPQ